MTRVKLALLCFLPNSLLFLREKNLEEVLQTETVFTNVSRGEVAKGADLKNIFKTDDHTKVCIEVRHSGIAKPNSLQTFTVSKITNVISLTKFSPRS